MGSGHSTEAVPEYVIIRRVADDYLLTVDHAGQYLKFIADNGTPLGDHALHFGVTACTNGYNVRSRLTNNLCTCLPLSEWVTVAHETEATDYATFQYVQPSPENDESVMGNQYLIKNVGTTRYCTSKAKPGPAQNFLIANAPYAAKAVLVEISAAPGPN